MELVGASGVEVKDKVFFFGRVKENRLDEGVFFFKNFANLFADFAHRGSEGRVKASGDKIGKFSDIVKNELFIADGLVIAVFAAKKIKNVRVNRAVLVI